MSSFLPPNISAARSLLFVGLGAQSYFWLANAGLAGFGIMPAVTKGSPLFHKLDVKQRVELWHFFFEKAAIPMISATAISGVSLITSSILSASTTQLRTFTAVSGLLSLLFFPWTGLVMLPNIRALEAALASGELDADVVSEGTSKDVSERVERWKTHHYVRMFTGGLGLLSTLVVVYLSGGGVGF